MGFLELLLLVLVVLLFFGASKLPGLGDGLGKAMRGFKEAMRSDPPPGPAAPKKDPPSLPGKPEA